MQIQTTRNVSLLARVFTQIIAVVALILGGALAVVFAASVAVVSLLAAALLGLAWMVMKARRPAPVRIDGVIEARRVGGHSWVAYGWDQRR